MFGVVTVPLLLMSNLFHPNRDSFILYLRFSELSKATEFWVPEPGPERSPDCDATPCSDRAQLILVPQG